MSDIDFRSFSDELQKIASEQKKPSKFGRWVKNTAVIGAGYGAGTAAGMLGEKAVRHFGRKKWRTLPTSTKARLIQAALGVASAGAALTAANVREQRRRADG